MSSAALDIGTLSGRIELVDNITSTMGLIIHKVDDLDEKFGGMGARVAESAAGFFTAEAALKGLEKIMELGIDIAKDLHDGLMFGADVEENFNRLAGAAGHVGATLLGELKDATHHTIDDLDLMKRVNTDLAAGLNLTDEQFKVLAKGAYSLAQATGTDVKTAFDTMSDAMLTGRTRAIALLTGKIDLAKAEEAYAMKLGVSTDKLSADGKMHAAREAILKSVGNATQRLGEQQEGFDEKVGQAQVVWTNFMDDLGKGISISPVLMAGINGIAEALTGAFGGKQQDLIGAIIHQIDNVAISAIAFAQNVVDAVAIAGRTWDSLKIIVGTSEQGFRAITYVLEEILLGFAKVGNFVSGGKLFGNFIDDTKKDLDRLYDAMAAGEAKLDGYKKDQDDWAVSTGHVNDALELVRQKMIAAQKAQDDAAASQKTLGTATEGTAKATNNLAIAADRANDVLTQTAEEAKKQREAWEELHSIGKSYEETIHGITQANLDSIKTYIDAGASQGALAAAYQITAAQVKAIGEEMKLEKKILDDQSARWADYNKMIADLSGDTEKSLEADINKWKDAQIRSHKEAKTDTADFYDWVGKTEKAMYAKSDQARLESDQHSKAYFDKIAREAQQAYEFALNHADQFTSGYISDLGKTADSARKTAANWTAALGGSMDEVTKKVRTLAGEMITVEEASKRMSQGGSTDINRANLAANAKTWGIPEDVAFAMAKRGFSFQEMIAAWKAGMVAQWVPHGPKIPGFRDGGVGDFGEGTLAVLHGKEAIVPLDGHAGGVGNVTNYWYVNGTAEETARKIADIQMRMLKQNRQMSSI